MNHEQVIQVISKPSHLRTNNEIEVILPWLRKKSNLLAGMNKNVILDVVRGCQHQRSPKEEVVIKQGDKGDCFYIILKGLVSVYIDAKISGEDETGPKDDEEEAKKKEEESKQKQDDKEQEENKDEGSKQNEASPASEGTGQDNGNKPTQTENNPKPTPVPLVKKRTLSNFAKKFANQQRQKKHDERKTLGKFIVRFETGRSFGEIALLSEDNVRNASIITDDDTDFLVIHRDLYNSTLKAFQEKEFREVKEFIDSQPLFFNWPPKFLSLLQMSMRKETFSIRSPIVTQGDEVDGLIFITSGESKVVVEPTRHRSQYPERWPFKDKYAVFEDDDFMRSRFGKSSAHGKKPRKRSAKPIKQKQITLRRNQGYAAAEKKAFQKSHELYFLVKGDIIGDTETVMNLSTHAHTVMCTSETQAYILDSKNYDRLITKKNPETSALLRDLVEIKLRNRISTPQGSQIPLLRHLYFDLTQKTEEVVNKHLIARNSKELPDKEILLQHLLDWFIHWKAPLIQPYVPGNVYYKNLMQERARIRANVRQQQMKMERRPTVALLPNSLRKQFDERKPRSISALKDAMKKLRSDKVSDILSPRREFLYRGIKEEDELNEEEKADSKRPTGESSQRKNLLGLPEFERRKDSVVRFQEEQGNVKADDNAEVIEQITIANSADFEESRTEGLNNATEVRSEPVFITEQANYKNILPTILGDREPRHNPAKTSQAEHDNELNLPTISGNSSRLKFYSQYVRQNLTPEEYESDEDDESGFRDYETSDSTLTFLEKRLQNFLAKNNGTSPGNTLEDNPRHEINLPKLKRFSCENPTLNAPRKGGRVMVKKHTCKFAHCNFVVKGHRHSKYFMVDELPLSANHRYSEKRVKQAQMVMNVLMGGVLPGRKSQSAKTTKSSVPT